MINLNLDSVPVSLQSLVHVRSSGLFANKQEAYIFMFSCIIAELVIQVFTKRQDAGISFDCSKNVMLNHIVNQPPKVFPDTKQWRHSK